MKAEIFLTIFLLSGAVQYVSANQGGPASAQNQQNYNQAKANLHSRYDYYLDELIFDHLKQLTPSQLALVAEFSKMGSQEPYPVGYYLNRNHSVIGRLEYTSRKLQNLLAYEYFYHTAAAVIADEQIGDVFYVIARYHHCPAVRNDAAAVYRVAERFAGRLRQLEKSRAERLRMLEESYRREQKQIREAVAAEQAEPSEQADTKSEAGLEAICFDGAGKSFAMIDGKIVYAGDKIDGAKIEAIEPFAVRLRSGFKSYTQSINSRPDFGDN